MSSVAHASPSRSRSGVTPKSCSAIAAPAAWSENSISVRSGSSSSAGLFSIGAERSTRFIYRGGFAAT